MTRDVAVTVLPESEAPSHRTGALVSGVLAIRALVLAVGLVTMMLWSQAPTPPLVWDERAYLYLVENGYPTPDDTYHLPRIAFFPLYHLMVRPLTAFLPPHVALLVVSNLCSLIGFVFAYLWVKSLSNDRLAAITILVLATSVNAVFFSRALTEGPFFMLVSITLWLMQTKRLLAAAAVCGLATFTRPTGAALAVTLTLYALLQYQDKPWARRLARTALVGLISVWGIAAYQAFLWNRYQKPDIYFTAQHHWEDLDRNRKAGEAQAGLPPRYSLQFFLDRAFTPQAWNRGFAVVILGLIIIGFVAPGPVPRVLFVLPLVIFLMTAVPNGGFRISSVVRYESAALPLFVLVAWWLSKLRRPAITVAILSLSLAVQLYYAVLFCREIWVG